MSENTEVADSGEDDTQGHVHPGEFPGFPTDPPKPKPDDSQNSH